MKNRVCLEDGRMEEREHTMSCRIDRLTGEDHVILCISGRITTEEVGVLRALLEQETGAVALDLKHVILVDREAIKLLALTETNGTELRNCAPYIREWVTKERAEADADRSEVIERREDIEDV